MYQNTPDKKLKIGLFGFGVVGAALYHVLQNKSSLNAEIKKVCIKHIDKKRNGPESLFTDDAAALLSDPDINVIVELIDDSDAAFEIVRTALKSGKAVVSANKKMVAEHLKELLELQSKYKVPLLYESACCASIPVIRNLEEYYDNDLLQSISGIVNGSTNYILTKVREHNTSFQQALVEAREAGFAESNPYMDVEGVDAVNKLSILIAHAYGIIGTPGDLVYSGIQRLENGDSQFANEKGLVIKLVAQARKLSNGEVTALVLPQFVRSDSQLFSVKDEYNGVVIESSLADKQFFCGKGAGGFPTASAVLSDLSALRYDYKYEYKKLQQNAATKLSDDYYLRVYVSFPSLPLIPHKVFEQIDEWSSNEHRCYVTGVIHCSKLLKDWWKRKGTSLILLPDPILEQYQKSTINKADAVQEFASMAP